MPSYALILSFNQEINHFLILSTSLLNSITKTIAWSLVSKLVYPMGAILTQPNKKLTRLDIHNPTRN